MLGVLGVNISEGTRLSVREAEDDAPDDPGTQSKVDELNSGL